MVLTKEFKTQIGLMELGTSRISKIVELQNVRDLYHPYSVEGTAAYIELVRYRGLAEVVGKSMSVKMNESLRTNLESSSQLRLMPNWPKPWRLKVYSCKDSNDQYRIEEYFESLDDLITRTTHLNNT